MSRRERYDLYVHLANTGLQKAAEVVVEESDTSAEAVGFRYVGTYVNQPSAFPLDPVQLPLNIGEKTFSVSKGLPAFLDDYLPDAWGRRVLTQVALLRDKKRLNARSVIDTLALLGHSHIGALSIVPKGTPPVFEPGCSIEKLYEAENVAQQIDQLAVEQVSLDQISLLHLANHGSGVGGARPKALIHEDGKHYLAKFNKIGHAPDPYNNARVELACLNMARAAGIHCMQGKIIEGINGREVLLLERFDMDKEARARFHLISVNGLLKSPQTQEDIGQLFRYDDIYRLLQKYSVNIEHDLDQLVRLMLFNRAINNTDDHERNFSLIWRKNGYQLAPAYDMVPNLARGQFHAAGFNLQAWPPSPNEALKMKRLFGLSKPEINRAAEAVIDAVTHWQYFAKEAGVSQEDTEAVSSVLVK